MPPTEPRGRCWEVSGGWGSPALCRNYTAHARTTLKPPPLTQTHGGHGRHPRTRDFTLAASPITRPNRRLGLLSLSPRVSAPAAHPHLLYAFTKGKSPLPYFAGAVRARAARTHRLSQSSASRTHTHSRLACCDSSGSAGHERSAGIAGPASTDAPAWIWPAGKFVSMLACALSAPPSWA